MQYDAARQEIVLKLVYYGPGLAGKTTNLTYLQRSVAVGRASEITSLDTHSERTLFFDFLAIDLGQIQGKAVRLGLYTVPGQSYYAATRRQVLAGADGVVFVADSRREALDENIDAMNEMLANLRHHGLAHVPVVLQYNKQDLPTAVPPEQFQPLMNSYGWPSFPAIATSGQGVSETCEALARLVADAMADVPLPVETPVLPVLDALPAAAVAATPKSPAPTSYRPPSTASFAQADPIPESPALNSGARTSWLITCFRCQSMLDVPSAGIGEIYTCGVCHTSLEVVDPERGMTRLPQGAAKPVTGSYRRNSAPTPSAVPGIDEELYQALEQPDDGFGTAALKPATRSVVRPAPVMPMGIFPVPGFTVVTLLDENPQGRRLRVRDDATSRTYRALQLSAGLLAQPGYRESVEPYTRMVGPVKHPHLLPLWQFHQTDVEQVFLSADPQDHEPLTHVLARRRALAPPHAIGIIRQAALALEEGARHGAIHGWLRPEVLLVSAEGNVLVDELCVPPNHKFVVRELSGVSAATEYYLAPEYLNDDLRGDVRTDIFLLGALLFRMITGEGLVSGYNAIEALHKLTANGPRQLRDAQPGISRDLNAFCAKLTAVDRGERFQTYHEVLAALDRFGGGAKRQNLQLTTGSIRSNPSRIQPSVPVPRRTGSTGQLPPAPRPRAVVREPSGAVPILPSTQRRTKPTKTSSSGPIFAALAVLLFLGVIIFAAMYLRNPPSQTRMDDDAARPPMFPTKTTTTTVASPKTTPGMTATTTQPPVAVAATTVAATTTTDDQAQAKRMELKRQLADLLVVDRFGDALRFCEKFAEGTDRKEAQDQVIERHAQRKKDLGATVKPGVDPEAVRASLEPVRKTWDMPGDLTWALALQSKADTLALGQPEPEVAVPVVPAEKPVDKVNGDWGPTKPAPLVMTDGSKKGDTKPAEAEPKTVAATEAPMAKSTLPDQPVVDPSSTVFGSVVRALIGGSPVQAEGVIAVADPALGVQASLRQMVAWWPHHRSLIDRVAKAKAAKLRMQHPATGESVDITSADERGMMTVSPSGGSSLLAWQLVPVKSLSQLTLDAASAPGANVDQLSGAICLQLIGDDLPHAAILARQGKAVLADRGPAVDRLISLAQRRQAVAVLNRGFDASRAGNAKGATDAYNEAKRFDKAALTGLEPEFERLSTVITAQQAPAPSKPTGTVPGTTPGEAEELAPGALPRDLKERQAALRVLGWEPIGNAYLDGAAVRLPTGSGISYPLNRDVAGFNVTATGVGYLRLVPARGLTPAQLKGGRTMPLNRDESRWLVRFGNNAMSIIDQARGASVLNEPLTAPPTIFAIISTNDATLPAVPQPIRD